MTESEPQSVCRQRVYEAFADRNRPFDDAVESALTTGVERLGLEIGFLTRIEDETQYIEQSVGNHVALRAGDQCPLSEAYCKQTVEEGGLLSVQDAAASPDVSMTAYDRLELGSYIGSKVVASGDTYGTVCFAARVPAASRIELRSPDPSCNPYLALAAMLQAGLDGIERGLDCPDPVRENIYEFDEAKREEYGIETLPGDLGEAVDALEDDEVIASALGEHVTEKFVEAKRQEYGEYIAEVSDWELERYLETF